MSCLFQHLAGDRKHPDKMTRKEMLQKIASFQTHADASSWWLMYACGKVSKKAFNKARGF